MYTCLLRVVDGVDKVEAECWALNELSMKVGSVSRDDAKTAYPPIRRPDLSGEIAVDQCAWRLKGIRMYTSVG
jgi:hypothetical protein